MKWTLVAAAALTTGLAACGGDSGGAVAQRFIMECKADVAEDADAVCQCAVDRASPLMTDLENRVLAAYYAKKRTFSGETPDIGYGKLMQIAVDNDVTGTDAQQLLASSFRTLNEAKSSCVDDIKATK